MYEKAGLYLNTIKYLKITQIFYQIKRAVSGDVKADCSGIKMKNPVKLYVPQLDADDTYISRFDCDRILADEIFLLNERHTIDLRYWTIDGQASRLWMFHLYDMEYLIPLAVFYTRTKNPVYYTKIKELLETWMDCFSDAAGDGWNAYVIAKRIPHWLIVMQLLEGRLDQDQTFRQRLELSLYRQYRHLMANQEKHLLGNHYFEDLKTLMIAGIAFGEHRNVKKYLDRFRREIKRQILKDGMHFERSFMYHKIIMEDILRVFLALRQENGYERYLEQLESVLARMLSCTVSFEGGLKRVPLFNDAGNNEAKTAEALQKGIERHIRCSGRKGNTDLGNADLENMNLENMNLENTDLGNTELFELPDAGYYKYRISNLTCIIDCGVIGPSYIPGHGQCDCLSYEVFADGYPVLVNSGTYQYQTSLREFFRSTQAHNCFTVNSIGQSQCWGEHRVAKRISKTRAERTEHEFTGETVFWNGTKVRRTMQFWEDGFTVQDQCLNRTDAVIRSYIHLAPGLFLTKHEGSRYDLEGMEKSRMHLRLEIIQAAGVYVHEQGTICSYSEEYGSIQKKKVFEITGNAGSAVVYRIVFLTES